MDNVGVTANNLTMATRAQSIIQQPIFPTIRGEKTLTLTVLGNFMCPSIVFSFLLTLCLRSLMLGPLLTKTLDEASLAQLYFYALRC